MTRRTDDIDFVNHLEVGQYINISYTERDRRSYAVTKSKEKKISNGFLKELLSIFQKCFTSEYTEEELVEEITTILQLEEYETNLDCINEKGRKEQIVDLRFVCNENSCKECFLFMSCSQFDKRIKDEFLIFNFLNESFQMKTFDYSLNEEVISRHHLKWKSEMFIGYLLYWINNA